MNEIMELPQLTNEAEGNTAAFLEFRRQLDDGEGEVNSATLKAAYADGEITKEELGDLALALLEKVEPRAAKAVLDELTGLANLRGFREKLNDVIADLQYPEESRRQDSPDSVMVVALDMNFLKTLNDTYGHDIGDAGLIALANRLKSALRETDLAARNGGDEFSLLIPIQGDNPEVYEAIFNKIKNKVSDLTIPIQGADGQVIDYPIATAAGYSVKKRGDETSAEELLAAADAAMYANKTELKGQ